jgi:hypothetical protein
MARIERATSPLPRECSTTEPHGHRHRLDSGSKQASGDDNSTTTRPTTFDGAGDGNRTRVISLEGWGSTIELLPPGSSGCVSVTPHPERQYTFEKTVFAWWRRLDSNQRRRKPTDLQSAPFSHSGTPPRRTAEYSTGRRPWQPAGRCRSGELSRRCASRWAPRHARSGSGWLR